MQGTGLTEFPPLALTSVTQVVGGGTFYWTCGVPVWGSVLTCVEHPLRAMLPVPWGALVLVLLAQVTGIYFWRQ